MKKIDGLEQEFIRKFDNFFCHLKDKRIVLYGIGYRTGAIIRELPHYNIIGMLDKEPENIGREFYGKNVLSINEAVNKADCIIIIAVSYWEVIYERIKKITDEYKIPVYFPNGEKAAISASWSPQDEFPYWNLTENYVIAEIKKHTIISFDIFDTLVMRKILYTDTVFDLLEMEIRKHCGLDLPFKLIRKNAETTLNSTGINPTLIKIYKRIEEIILSEFQLQFDGELWMQRELSLEKSLCVPRKRILKWLKYAINLRKMIYLISDMYLDKGQMSDLLQSLGIDINPEYILISSEIGQSKEGGGMWEHLLAVTEMLPENILHIGDNVKSDKEMPELYGIHAIQVLSASEILKRSSCGNIMHQVTNSWESLCIGLCAERLFNDPFAVNKTRGKVNISASEELGFVAFGSLILGFVIWILQNALSEGIDLILFMARDGFFLEKDFVQVSSFFDKTRFISSEYLKVSRQLAYYLNCTTLEGIEEFLTVAYRGSLEELFRNRFYIECREKTKTRQISLPEDKDIVLNAISPYLSEIQERAKRNRKCYFKYLHNLEKESHNVAVVDFGYSGSSQYMLSKLRNKEYIGLYFLANMSSENIFNKNQKKKSYIYDAENLGGESKKAYNLFSIIESVYTAESGTYLECLEKGFRNAEPMKNQEYFQQKRDIHDGVTLFIDEALCILSNVDLEDVRTVSELSSEWMNQIFSKGYVDIANNLKDTFWMDDIFRFKTDRNIFE